MKVVISVPDQRVSDVLTNAADCAAFAYWIRRDTFTVKPGVKWGPREGMAAPLRRNGAWLFETEDGRLVKLDSSAVERGLIAMATKHPKLFADLLSGEDDAITADVLVQCCAFGEVLYG